MGRIHDRNRRRRFDEARAGAWSRGLAHRRLDAFVRANVLQLTLSVLGVATLAAGLWLALSPWAPSPGFALGVFVTGSLAAMYHWCVLASGAVNGTMGAAAEEWTATELRRLRRQGWRTINHLVFRKGDIDHIAIGPDGVIVVETKWKSDDRAVEDDAAWLATAAEQAKRNERDVARFLGWGARRDARITALVVVWGPHIEQRTDEAARIGRDVNVVAGERLREELSHLGDAKLTPGEIDAVYETLRRWVGKKDQWSAHADGPQRPTVAQIANRWLLRVGTGLLGMYGSAFALRLGGWYFAAAAGFVAVGLAGRRRFDSAADLAISWIAGSQAITIVVTFVVAWHALS